MVRHHQAGHDFALEDVAFHDLGDVSVRFHLIPHAFRIDHDARAHGAMIETAGFVRPDDSFQIEPFRLLFEPGMQGFGAEFRTAAARIVGASLVGADEDMACKAGHDRCYVGIVAVFNRSINRLTSPAAMSRD